MANICLTQKNVKSLNWGGDAQVETNSKLCTIGYSLIHFGATRKSGYEEDEYPDNRIITGTGDPLIPVEVQQLNTSRVVAIYCHRVDIQESTIDGIPFGSSDRYFILYKDGNNFNQLYVCFKKSISYGIGGGVSVYVTDRDELNAFPSGAIASQQVLVSTHDNDPSIPDTVDGAKIWRVQLVNDGIYASSNNDLIAIYIGTNPPPRDVPSSYCRLTTYVDNKLVTEIFPTYSITYPSAITSAIDLSVTTTRSSDIAVAVKYNDNTRDFIPYSSSSTNPNLNVTFTSTFGSLNYGKKSHQDQNDIQAYYVERVSNSNDLAYLNFKYTGNHHTINLNPATAQIQINNSDSKIKISILFSYIRMDYSKIFIEDMTHLDKIDTLYGIISQQSQTKATFNADLNGEWIESTEIPGFNCYQVVVGEQQGGDSGTDTIFACWGAIKNEYQDRYELEDKTQHER